MSLYNIHLHYYHDEKDFILVLDKVQVQRTARAFKSKQQDFRILGKIFDLQSVKNFIVYEIITQDLGKEKDEVFGNIKKWLRAFDKKGQEEYLEDIGRNVSDDFLLPEETRPQPIVLMDTDSFPDSIVTDSRKNIFISHSSEDRDMVKKFVDIVLILGMHVKREDIFFTSGSGTDIKSGNDFRNEILHKLKTAKSVIQFITANYKRSEVCLNEMGAAWVICDTVIPIVASPFTYDVGFIHSKSQQLKLNSKNDLLKLYEDHKGAVFPPVVNSLVLIEKVEEFISYVDNLREIESNENCFFFEEKASIEGYIESGIHGGPPWDEDPEMNSYHRYFALKTEPINILRGNMIADETDNNYSKFDQTRFHLLNLDGQIDLRSFRNKKVRVEGFFLTGHTAWHRTDILFDMKDIQVI